MTNTQEKTVSAADIADLDNILGDINTEVSQDSEELLEAVDQAVAGVVNDPEEVVEIDTSLDNLELDDTELNKVAATMERHEAYHEQEAPVAAVSHQKSETTQTVVKPKKAKTPATPRAPRDMASIEPRFFLLEGTLPTEQADLDAMKAATLARIPTQKKIAEKFENLFANLSAGKDPSTFIKQAFLLLEKNRSMSSADLVAFWKTVGAKSDTEGYDEGTARSQAGQIMNLFDAVKIATRTKQQLDINPNSVVAARLRDILKVNA